LEAIYPPKFLFWIHHPHAIPALPSRDPLPAKYFSKHKMAYFSRMILENSPMGYNSL